MWRGDQHGWEERKEPFQGRTQSGAAFLGAYRTIVKLSDLGFDRTPLLLALTAIL